MTELSELLNSTLTREVNYFDEKMEQTFLILAHKTKILHKLGRPPTIKVDCV